MQLLSLLFTIFIFTGCTQDVKSWEKGTLSKSQLQDTGGHTLLKSAKEQIFISKEASRGGGRAGGGGCGCK